MKLRSMRTLAELGALAVPTLTASLASAQPVYVEPDRARFRGGVNLEAGALLVPAVNLNLGEIAIQGEMGAQINNNWGVYVIPTVEIPFGRVFGIGASAGVLADYTFTGLPIGVALGPEVGGIVGLSGLCNANSTSSSCASNNSLSSFAGAYYGARARFTYYPVIVREGWRRRGLALGVDLRFIAGAFASETTTTTPTGGSVSGTAGLTVGLAPMVFIGYAAF